MGLKVKVWFQSRRLFQCSKWKWMWKCDIKTRGCSKVIQGSQVEGNHWTEGGPPSNNLGSCYPKFTPMQTLQYLHQLWSVLWLQLLLKQTLQIHVIDECPCRRPHFYSSASRQCPPKLGNFPLEIVTSLFPLSFTKLGNCTQSLFIALRRCWSLCYHFLAEKYHRRWR